MIQFNHSITLLGIAIHLGSFMLMPDTLPAKLTNTATQNRSK